MFGFTFHALGEKLKNVLFYFHHISTLEGVDTAAGKLSRATKRG